MHIAAAHHPPTTRRHYPAGQRMKGVVDRLFARQNPGAMSLSRPAPARRISPSPSREAASAPDRAVASSPPSISSISSRQEGRAGRQGRLADYLTRLDFVILDELGYLPFAPGRRAVAVPSDQPSLRARPRSSSRPTSPSANGRACSATRRFHDASLLDRLVRRTLALSTAAWFGDSEICQGIPLASCVPVNHPFRSQSNMT